MKRQALSERVERLVGDGVAIVTGWTLGAAYRISKRLDPDDSKWGFRVFTETVISNWAVTYLMRKHRQGRHERDPDD
jgi:hypothetical protein